MLYQLTTRGIDVAEVIRSKPAWYTEYRKSTFTEEVKRLTQVHGLLKIQSEEVNMEQEVPSITPREQVDREITENLVWTMIVIFYSGGPRVYT